MGLFGEPGKQVGAMWLVFTTLPRLKKMRIIRNSPNYPEIHHITREIVLNRNYEVYNHITPNLLNVYPNQG